MYVYNYINLYVWTGKRPAEEDVLNPSGAGLLMLAPHLPELSRAFWKCLEPLTRGLYMDSKRAIHGLNEMSIY